jgi:hypothetical protein
MRMFSIRYQTRTGDQKKGYDHTVEDPALYKSLVPDSDVHEPSRENLHAALYVALARTPY